MTTAEQIRKLTAALAECNRFIAIESAKSADLRPVMQQRDWGSPWIDVNTHAQGNRALVWFIDHFSLAEA
jgi:hypothetical protein